MSLIGRVVAVMACVFGRSVEGELEAGRNIYDRDYFRYFTNSPVLWTSDSVN